MSKHDRGGDRSNNGDEASPRVLKGPWDNLPATKTTREPILKRGARGRETIISSWRGLAIFIFLLVCAPPIVAWVTRFIMGLVAQR